MVVHREAVMVKVCLYPQDKAGKTQNILNSGVTLLKLNYDKVNVHVPHDECVLFFIL